MTNDFEYVARSIAQIGLLAMQAVLVGATMEALSMAPWLIPLMIGLVVWEYGRKVK